MTIRVAINHRTTYKFDRAVSLSPHTVRLRPAAHSRTPIHSYSLKIKPADHFINWQQDAFGNYLARLVFPHKCTEFEVDVEVHCRYDSHQPLRLLRGGVRTELSLCVQRAGKKGAATLS